MGHVRFESSCPSHVCLLADFPCAPGFSSIPPKRPHSRPDDSAHVCRKAERNGTKLVPSEQQIEIEEPRNKTVRSREENTVRGRRWSKEEEKHDVRSRATFVSVATKTNDDCDKHFGASAFRPIRMEQSWCEENARFHFLEGATDEELLFAPNPEQ